MRSPSLVGEAYQDKPLSGSPTKRRGRSRAARPSAGRERTRSVKRDNGDYENFLGFMHKIYAIRAEG
jgi:hypothetical protein